MVFSVIEIRIARNFHHFTTWKGGFKPKKNSRVRIISVIFFKIKFSTYFKGLEIVNQKEGIYYVLTINLRMQSYYRISEVSCTKRSRRQFNVQYS